MLSLLHLTNVLLKGHTFPYLVMNVWYLLISYAVPLECIEWLLIRSLWTLMTKVFVEQPLALPGSTKKKLGDFITNKKLRQRRL